MTINKFDGQYRFLSNFYPCKIEHDGILYHTVEAYYVAMKSNSSQTINGMIYTPMDFRKMIASIKSPRHVKKIGKNIKIRPNWDSKKLEYMTWAVNEKFKDNTLRDLLLATESLDIVEGNWWHDNFYGQCICDKCANKGKNKLGKLLMQIRNKLNGKIGLEQLF